MDLEFAMGNHVTDDAYPMPLGAGGVIDWAPAVQALLEEFRRASRAAKCAAKFHNALAEATVAVAHKAGEKNVVLTGGCFQNSYLTERVIRRLRDEGFRPFWHQRVPPNDGGIALGQIAAAAHAHAHTNK
jgi:hydrogenase maturation protein HypF